MKKETLKKTNKTWSFAAGMALGAIGTLFLIRKKENNQDAGLDQSIDRIISGNTAENNSKAVTPIVYGIEDGKKFKDLFREKGWTEPIRYNKNDIINFISRYVKRVINVRTKPNHPGQDEGDTNVVKSNEPLVLYIPFGFIEILLAEIPEGELEDSGIMAIFAIDTMEPGSKINKNQTFVLMPYGKDKKAIIRSEDAYAIERWDSANIKLSSIIRNDNNGDIGLNTIKRNIKTYLEDYVESKNSSGDI